MNAASRERHPAGVLEIARTSTDRARLSRQSRAGRAMQLAPGIYAVGATLPAAAVARHHLLAVVAHVWPSAVICDRSALAGGQPVDGYLFICHPHPPRAGALQLPGVTVTPRVGPGPLPGDMPMPDGLFVSGPVRQLLENIPARGRPGNPPRLAGVEAMEDKIEEEARRGGPGKIARMLESLEVLRGSFPERSAEKVRQRLAALVGTALSDTPISPRYAARLGGQPYDQGRLDLIAGMVETLRRTPPSPRPTLGDPKGWEWEPFFESYFSNFIEGTEFGVEEARQIAVEGLQFHDRPQDTHDIAATYRLVSDHQLATRVPRTGDELVELLRSHHATLMAARPDKNPGEFKARPNFAGGYEFVCPELVEGTLRRGFELLDGLTDPFQSALAMMLLLTEAHPFDDGNGRIARILANAELSHAGQVRIIVPTSYRNDYIAGLNGVSNRAGQGQTLISVLDFAQRWTAAVDWSTYELAHQQLTYANAYVDPGIAERSGQRLRMPAR
jgi:hypothetical protein